MGNQLTKHVSILSCWSGNKRGQTLVEYALILSFMSVLSIIFLSAMGVEIRGLYIPIVDALQAAQRAIQ